MAIPQSSQQNDAERQAELSPLGGETTMSSLAVSDGDLFIRTYDNLWCIGPKVLQAGNGVRN